MGDPMDHIPTVYDNGHRDGRDAYTVREVVIEMEDGPRRMEKLFRGAAEYFKEYPFEQVIALQLEYEDDSVLLRMCIE
jgi:hypothetical protein